jgi:preprotein translocase subunit SecG
MSTLLLIIHSIIVIMIIGLVLLQRSQGGILGMSSGLGGLMTGRGQRNPLTRATAILAALFFTTSLGISIVAGWEHKKLDKLIPITSEEIKPIMPEKEKKLEGASIPVPSPATPSSQNSSLPPSSKPH